MHVTLFIFFIHLSNALIVTFNWIGILLSIIVSSILFVFLLVYKLNLAFHRLFSIDELMVMRTNSMFDQFLVEPKKIHVEKTSKNLYDILLQAQNLVWQVKCPFSMLIVISQGCFFLISILLFVPLSMLISISKIY